MNISDLFILRGIGENAQWIDGRLDDIILIIVLAGGSKLLFLNDRMGVTVSSHFTRGDTLLIFARFLHH